MKKNFFCGLPSVFTLPYLLFVLRGHNSHKKLELWKLSTNFRITLLRHSPPDPAIASLDIHQE